jgi:hypothetical protein
MQPPLRVLAAMLLLAGGIALATPAPRAALGQFQDLQGELQRTHRLHEWAGYLGGAHKLATLLHDSPDALLELARARLQSGDLPGALSELQRFARLGQAVDLPAVSADFAPLVRGPGFGAVQRAMEGNTRPVSLAATALRLGDAALLAEDLDYEPASGQFFVSSVREHKIIAVRRDGAARDFASAPDPWPLVALKIDAAHDRLWVTEVAMHGLQFSPAADWGRSALLCYQLSSGRLLRRIEGPHNSALGDMTLTAGGEVLVSDGDGGGLYRLSERDAALRRIDGGEFISPQTPALHADGRHLFVPDYLRGIAVLDLATGRVRWLTGTERFALNGIDGLYYSRGRLLAVQNGTSPQRVVAFEVDAALRGVQAQTLIERATPDLDPTHGLLVGADFYYLADSGWAAVDEQGRMKPGAHASGARLMRVSLAALAQARRRSS